MQEKIYFIPGWGETKKFKHSEKLIKALEKKFKVIPVQYISKWGTLPSQNIKIILDQIEKPSSRDICIGFSIGALYTFILSRKIKFKKIILCSISPFLENDLDAYPKKEVSKMVSHEEVKEFKKTKYVKPKSLTVYICGSKENKEVIYKTKWLAKKFESKLIIVKNTDHELSEGYIKAIEKAIDKNFPS